MTKFSKIQKAIIDSICYRAVFDFPLSFFQISHFLLSDNLGEIQVSSSAKLEREVEGLVTKGVLDYVDKRYFLKGRNMVDWYKRFGYSKDLVEEGKRVCGYLEKIPWVEFIGITGAISAFGAEEKDDIDFLIISQAKRLWITRFFVFLILFILGKLRRDSSFEKKICPNIFLAKNNLGWSKDQRNLYVAYEIAMIYPLYDRGETYFEFVDHNRWVFDYFANLKPSYLDSYFVANNKNINNKKRMVVRKGAKGSNRDRDERSSLFMGFLEYIVYVFQRFYMQGKKTTEDVGKDKIHFKKHDHKDRIMDKYKSIRKSYLK